MERWRFIVWLLALFCGTALPQLWECRAAEKGVLWQQNLPQQIPSGEQGTFHAQGIAFDKKNQCVYISFTTSLIKVDLQGRTIGSVVGLTGHLGCMALNPDDNRLYASIEYKHDAIGAGIAQGLGGTQNDEEDGFYIAIFDVDRINRMEMEASEVMKTVYIREAVEDFNASVTNQGRSVEHRYGCSGIDGVAIGPRVGKPGGRNVLYIADGIYGDSERNDNDYQVILCYDLKKWAQYERILTPQNLHHSGPSRPLAKYFVLTGNTEWGIQNLAYDPYQHALLAAVYKGKKAEWPNYSLFAIDLSHKAKRKVLRGVEPESRGKVLSLLDDGISDLVVCGTKTAGEQDEKTAVRGWRFRWGSTGLCPLGNGYYYISEDSRNPQTKRQSTTVSLYRWDGISPFSRVANEKK